MYFKSVNYILGGGQTQEKVNKPWDHQVAFGDNLFQALNSA